MHPRCNTMSSPAHSPSQGGEMDMGMGVVDMVAMAVEVGEAVVFSFFFCCCRIISALFLVLQVADATVIDFV
jgi:hypothetical protein